MRIAAIVLGCVVSAHAFAGDFDEPARQGSAAEARSESSLLTKQATRLIGTRYKYGGNSPRTGFDCSGYVRYVFRDALDLDLPRTSVEMAQAGRKIKVQALQPGDLVFYNTLRRPFSHVGIYLGNNRFVHSPKAGDRVRVEDMELDYWRNRFNGARRFHRSHAHSLPGSAHEDAGRPKQPAATADRRKRNADAQPIRNLHFYERREAEGEEVSALPDHGETNEARRRHRGLRLQRAVPYYEYRILEVHDSATVYVFVYPDE